MNNIGKRLKQIRKGKGFSLRGLGKAAHVSHSFIADIESGRSKPSLDTLDALAKALDVSILELTGSDEQNVVDVGDNSLGHTPEHTDIKHWSMPNQLIDPELEALWTNLLCREDLRAMLKQVRNYEPETVRKLVETIGLVEKEGKQ
jgi:transcriptional regulator with XRE-family HTH domain